MKFRHYLLLISAALVCSAAVARVPPPRDPFGGAIDWPQISMTPPATDLMLGSFRIRLEKTRLDAIAEAAGGTIRHQGDAAGSTYWLCYTLPHQRMWIRSNGEMGGPGHAVSQVDARAINQKSSDTGCPALPRKLQPMSLHGGIGIGSTAQAVSRALGKPSHIAGAWQSFNYAGKVPGQCPPNGFDLTNWVLVKIAHGRVVEIKAGQVTSC